MTNEPANSTRRTLVNLVSATSQVAISSASLLILYSVLLSTLGPGPLGIWSLIVATGSLVQLANLGIAGSTTKQVADLTSSGSIEQAAEAVETAAISMLILVGSAACIAFPIAVRYLAFALDGEDLESAEGILPYGLIAFGISLITTVYQGALYGTGLILHRNSILIIEAVSFPLAAYFLSKEAGLIGLAYARVLQNGITLLLTVLALRAALPVALLPHKWRTAHLKSVLGYASRIQLISLLVLACDPLTKGFLSRFGEVSDVGFYEMANRLVLQFRGVFSSAGQLLVPSAARLVGRDDPRLAHIRKVSSEAIFLVGLIGYSLLIAASPLISELWIGERVAEFYVPLIFLSVGWFINSLSIPAYNVSLGTGNLTPNLVSHVLMTLTNVALCLFLGFAFNAFGVVAGWAIALAVGGISMTILFKEPGSRTRPHFLSVHSWRALCQVSAGLVAMFGLRYGFLVGFLSVPEWANTFWLTEVTLLLAFAGLVCVCSWNHPVRQELLAFVSDALKTKDSGKLL